MATIAAETQGKGSVLAIIAAETQCKGSALRRAFERLAAKLADRSIFARGGTAPAAPAAAA